MIYIQLLTAFFKVGLFSFGGGYAMIPLIEKEVAAYGWLTHEQFLNIIAVAAITPGPIAVNSATYVGYRSAGFWGGVLATFGVVLPSFILVLVVSNIILKYQQHFVVTGIFYGIRPVVIGLIITAAVIVAQTSVFNGAFSINLLSYINWPCLFTAVISALLLVRFKLHPVMILLIAGFLGVIFAKIGVL